MSPLNFGSLEREVRTKHKERQERLFSRLKKSHLRSTQLRQSLIQLILKYETLGSIGRLDARALKPCQSRFANCLSKRRSIVGDRLIGSHFLSKRTLKIPHQRKQRSRAQSELAPRPRYACAQFSDDFRTGETRSPVRLPRAELELRNQRLLQ